MDHSKSKAASAGEPIPRPPAVTLERYLTDVAATGLLSAEQLQAFIAELPAERRPKDAQQLAQALVRDGKLTAFQASAVFQGRAANLVLGEYVILDRIGAGGMGQVFKAEHRYMRRVVALKILPARVSRDADAIARFRREVQVAARLSHPHVVAAHDARHEQGIHYLVMELVDGSDLSSLVKRKGPLAIDQAVHCVLQAAKGLAYAHAEGVVHRDVKPANLLLDKRGFVKLLDLGLARLDNPSGDPTDNLTNTGSIMGTVDYMAPEQALNTKRADARSDVYSLGCTLYYLLIGQPLYSGETAMEKLMAHREAPIPSLRVLRDEVPAELDRVFQRMVAKQPEARYQTMAEVEAALTACLPGANNSLGQTAQFSVDSLSDSNLVTFLRSVETGTKSIRTTAAPHDDTLNFDAAEATPRPLIGSKASGSHGGSASLRRRAAAKKNSTIYMVAGGGTAVAIIGAGIIWALMSGGREPPISSKSIAVAVPKQSPSKPAAAKLRVAPPTAKVPFSPEEAHKYQVSWARYLDVPVEFVNQLGMRLVLIPPGEFDMGSTEEEIAEAIKSGELSSVDSKRMYSPEGPRHRVRLTQPFFVGAHEVTIAQFGRFIRDSGYRTLAEVSGKGCAGYGADGKLTTVRVATYIWSHPGDIPYSNDSAVTQVAWDDAVEFCNFLSDSEGLVRCYARNPTTGCQPIDGNGYRLPTEAEWEYACRAGNAGKYCFGDNDLLLSAYAEMNTIYAPVGEKLTNAFGLFDVHGRIREWCQDWFGTKYYSVSPNENPLGPPSGSAKAFRGSFGSRAVQTRSAFRYGFTGDRAELFDQGFRVTRGTSPAAKSVSLFNPGGAGIQSKLPALANAPFDAKQAPAVQEAWAAHLGAPVERTDKAGVRLRLIPPGEFEMGQTPDEIAALLKTEPAANDVEVNDLKSEAPRHRVRISRPFYLGEREITVAQFRKFVDATKYKTDAERDGFGGAIFDDTQMKLISRPEINWREPGFKTKGDQRPVCQVSWNDAWAFCRWLSQQESATYRLPTEAEWEYACRAGTTTTFYFGDDPAELQYNAWIAPESEGEAHPGGTKLPNAFGLCDMIGNVREWCQDVWDPSYYAASPAIDPPGPAKGMQRVVRGSYWVRTGSAREHHCGLRRSAGPSSRSWYQGFRVVCEVQEPTAK